MIAFGPVPSRRLGRSLGINNIPAKICTFACVYCQLGNTLQMQVKRQAFYQPEQIATEVEAKVQEAQQRGEKIDYLAFVPDGEPTLDLNLKQEISLLRPLGIPIAIITNASLVDLPETREALAAADWVSLKVDAVTEAIWHKVDRPHGSLQIESLHRGMLQFAEMFRGELATETMLVEGINDSPREMTRVAAFLKQLSPAKAYIAIPTRPPAEAWVHPASEEAIAAAYHIFSDALGEEHVEYLIGYEGDAFAFTGNVEEDLLSITSVHPMREQAVHLFLQKAGADWSVVERLLADSRLIRLAYQTHTFYMRKLPGRKATRDDKQHHEA